MRADALIDMLFLAVSLFAGGTVIVTSILPAPTPRTENSGRPVEHGSSAALGSTKGATRL
jgi:hypothetical protein